MAFNFNANNNNKKTFSVNTNSKIFKNYREGEFNVALRCTFWNEKLKLEFIPKMENVQADDTSKEYFNLGLSSENKCPVYYLTETNLQAFIDECENILHNDCICERPIARESSRSETPSYLEISNRNATTGEEGGLYLNVYVGIRNRDVNERNTYTYQFTGESVIANFNTENEEIIYRSDTQFREFIQLLKEYQKSLLNATAHSVSIPMRKSFDYSNNLLYKLMNSSGVSYNGKSNYSSSYSNQSNSQQQTDYSSMEITDDEIPF